MAKVYTGRDGVMQLAGVTLAKVSNFSLQSDLETLETTTLNENIRTYSPGILGYSGSANLLYYKDDSNAINTANLLNKLIKTGTDGISSSDTVELTFRWVDGADNNDIKLTAYITSATIGASTGEIVSVSISFVGTGALATATIS
jgi:hypothetical protein|tara:strand:+ start:9783 stop:10217 length:435 start_codon:yes stop_codon:yes gene_type:complete